MSQRNNDIDDVRRKLTKKVDELDDARSVLRGPELKGLFKKLSSLSPKERAKFGQQLNSLKNEIIDLIQAKEDKALEADIIPLDVSAPFSANVPDAKKPRILSAKYGSKHPVAIELERINCLLYTSPSPPDR